MINTISDIGSGFASRPWLVVPGVAALHVSFSIGYLIDNSVGNITALSLLHLLAGSSIWLILMSVAVISVLPMFFRMPATWVHRCLWPQQTILFLMATAAITAALRGKYPDGTVRSFAFILTDQCYAVWLMLMHLSAIMRNAKIGRLGNGHLH